MFELITDWETNKLNPAIFFDCTGLDIGAIQLTLLRSPGAAYPITVQVSIDRVNWFTAVGIGNITAPSLTVQTGAYLESMIYNLYWLTPYRFVRISSATQTGSFGEVRITVRAHESRIHPRAYQATGATWSLSNVASDAALRFACPVANGADAGTVQVSPQGTFTGSAAASIDGTIDGIGWVKLRALSDKAASPTAVTITHSSTPAMVTGINLSALTAWRLTNTAGTSSGQLSLTMASYKTQAGVGLDRALGY